MSGLRHLICCPAPVCRPPRTKRTATRRARAINKSAMSDKHDHKHDHDHGHDHDHDHGHSHGEIKLKEPSAPAPAPEPTPERAQDDAGSTALSDALRSSFTIVKFVMIGLVVFFFV